MKRYIYIIILTIIFTFFIFYIKNVFFSIENKNVIESKYIEQSIIIDNLYKKIKPNNNNNNNNNNNQDKQNNQDKLNNKQNNQRKVIDKQSILNNKQDIVNENKIKYEKIKQKILELRKRNEAKQLASKISFYYIPKNYEEKVINYTKIISSIVRSNIFNDKIISLAIEMFKKKIDVRGKMKNGKVKLFGVSNIRFKEFVGLFLHEFAHYIDLYYFNKTIFSDKSDLFYNISWNSTKILKKGQKSKDFVSGYAMTNKYEDFAESFTYYILHNGDFLYKANKSNILKNKYLFFKQVLFKNGYFANTNFSNNKKTLDYYRDITKINIKEQKFLQYIQK